MEEGRYSFILNICEITTVYFILYDYFNFFPFFHLFTLFLSRFKILVKRHGQVGTKKSYKWRPGQDISLRKKED